MTIKPINFVVLDNNIAIRWSDNSESFIDTKILRKACPCANCSGESDVFGNVYLNQKSKSLNKQGTIIIKYSHVGHYAIRIVWGDGHNNGIYSFKLLKSLDDQ
jgi:DUF971 family protein